MVDWLNDNTGIVLTLTLLAVLWYAWEARKQARASRAMAEEMRERRMAEDRPYLLIKLLEYSQGGKVPTGMKAEDCYPQNLLFRITNWGPGPAIEVEMTAVHPKADYGRSAPKGYLLEDESMTFEVSEGFHRPSGRGLSEYLLQCGLTAEPGHTLGLVVRYRDVHGRIWLAWISFDYETEPDSDGDVVWGIREGSPRVEKLQDSAGAQSWQVLFGGSVAPHDRGDPT